MHLKNCAETINFVQENFVDQGFAKDIKNSDILNLDNSLQNQNSLNQESIIKSNFLKKDKIGKIPRQAKGDQKTKASDQLGSVNAIEERNENGDHENKKKFKPLVTAFQEKGGQESYGQTKSFLGEHMYDNISLINESSQQKSISVNYFKNLKENSMR